MYGGLRDSATITRRTSSGTGDFGEPSYGEESTVASNVPCRLYKPGGGQMGGRIPHVAVGHRLIVPSGTDIEEVDVVTVTAEDGTALGVFQVDFVGRVGGGHHLEIDLSSARERERA